MTNSIGMKLVRIEPGTFSMGQAGPASDYRMHVHPAKFDDADWDEQPVHRVTISTAFQMGVTEVTVGQFRQKPLRDLEDRLDLLIREVIDRNDMTGRRQGLGH